MEKTNELLGELIKEVRILSAKVESLKIQLDDKNKTFAPKEVYRSDIYNRFLAFTKEGYYGKPPSESEWNELEELFHSAYPRYYQLIAVDNKLTRDQLRLCLLIRLSFPHYVMARIMDVDGKRVTRLKTQVNSRLFNERCAKTLENHLRSYF